MSADLTIVPLMRGTAHLQQHIGQPTLQQCMHKHRCVTTQQPTLMLSAGESLVILQYTWICQDGFDLCFVSQVLCSCSNAARYLVAGSVRKQKLVTTGLDLLFVFGKSWLLCIARQAKQLRAQTQESQLDGVQSSCAWPSAWAVAR